MTTASTSKIRIYELAKELKLESKRVLEDVRREGIDVSVPSNTISKELAEKIRNKYFPKKETAPSRGVRVVKRAVRTVAEENADAAGDDQALTATEDQTGNGAPTLSAQPGTTTTNNENETSASVRPNMTTTQSRPMAVRVIKPLAPAQRAESPSVADRQPTTQEDASFTNAEFTNADAPIINAPEALDQGLSTDMSALSPTPIEQLAEFDAASLAEQSSTEPSALPPARQVRVLTLTSEALKQGVRPGERVSAPVPAATPASRPAPAAGRGERERSRGGRGGKREDEVMVRGTPGETATPQTTYIPPADARRQRSRSGRNVRGGSPAARGKDGRGRFDRDFVTPARPLSLEERVAGSLNMSVDDGLKEARIVEGSTVKEFAEKLGIKPKDVVALLLQRGVFATMNQPLNDEVAVDLGQRFGFDVKFVPFEEMVTEQEFEELIATDADDVELPRAPVVTVMGHVDHGKTSLLDAIRTTDVAAGEAGGITQHIGAYSAYVSNPDTPTELRRVVFLDTPGHEAFTMMRARGAKATDIVVLVVAADDGVMPQTIEAIDHAKAAGVPIIVAINKIDKPDANTDRVKQELSGHGLQPLDWGGDTEMVLVSAKKRENIDNLLETILLTADILDLKASSTRLASGIVLEAKLDRGRGSVATVLVQQGTLRAGDPFIAGQVFGKVRAMFSDRGEALTEVGPATPVEVLGLQGVAQAGDALQVVTDIARAQSISSHRQAVTRQNTLLQSTKRGIEALGEQEIKELLVVLKADVQGSVEVLKSTLQKLSTETVKVRVIRSGVGAITESDVLLASATQAGQSSTAVVIIGFNVRPEVRAADLAKQELVDIRLHSIIYKVEEEIHAAMIGMLDAIEQEKILGKAEVREVFRVPKLGAVAGCTVLEGVIRRNVRARLIRDGVVAWEGGIASLRRFKEDAAEVRQGFECGIGLENFNDIKVSDQIEAYIIEKIAATEL